MRLYILLFYTILLPFCIHAQVLPAEGARLNYRLVGFSFPDRNSQQCKIDIAQGTFNNLDSFSENIIISRECSTGKEIVELPAFGKTYTWRITDRYKNDTLNNRLYHFATRTIPSMDTSEFKLKITHAAEKFKKDYVFVDGNNALYDMEGNPLWFPCINLRGMDSVMPLRDLKMTNKGTITFLTGTQAFEINYNGDMLWHGPDNGAVSGSESENYHHQLSMLSNGNYMILGNQWALCKKPDSSDKNMHLLPFDKTAWEKDQKAYLKIFLGTLIEYDSTGNVVWTWYSSKYFVGSDVDNYRDPNPKDRYNIDVHENAFYFDEKEQVIYLSFRNINRLLKIKYPTGEVLASYGETFKPGDNGQNNGFYCGQHSCLPIGGLLYVYDNAICKQGSMPRILALQEPKDGSNELKEVWNYPCTVEDSAGSKIMSYSWASGGNIISLPGNALFVCMGGSYSKMFILDENKNILWSALPERWQTKYNDWLPLPGYRASIIDRASLEKIIWNNEQPEVSTITMGRTTHSQK